MLPGDPNTLVGAKAVDVGAANRFPTEAVVEGTPREPTPLLTTTPGATPKAFVVLKALLNRPPVLVAEVDEPSDTGLVTAVVVVGGDREVRGRPPAVAEAFVEAGVILRKNGLAVLVAVKADADPDKLSGLLATVVLEEVVVLDLVPPRKRSNTPVGVNAGVVVGAPKMVPAPGSVLAAVVDDTMLDLLPSDKACAKTPTELVDAGKPDGVIMAGVLVSLFSVGVPLEGRET